MKQFFTKIVSFTLAFLVLFSMFSFTIDKHYCGDFLMDVSFVGETEGCGMEMDSVSKKKKNCCKDETQKVEGQDELQLTSLDKITIKKEQFIIAFVFLYQDLFIENSINKFIQKEFPPPEISLDYQIAYQTFLI